MRIMTAIPAFALVLLPNATAHPGRRFAEKNEWGDGELSRNQVNGKIPFHRRAENNKHAQITIVDQSVEMPTQVPHVIVYVDNEGNKIKTATETIMVMPTFHSDQVNPQPSVAPKPIPKASELPVPDGGSNGNTGSIASGELIKPTPAPAIKPPPATVSTTRSSSLEANSNEGHNPKPSPLLTAAVSASGLNGIAYAPYNKDGTCRTAGQVDSDFEKFAGKYSVVRLYGTDCGQIPLVYESAKRVNIKLFLGIFELGRLEQQVALIVSGVAKDWGIIHTISVGNELVNNRQASSQQVLEAVAKTKQLLLMAGYTGPVTTVDTFVAVREHPELCTQVDVCAINVHPFFDGNTAPESAGSFVRDAFDDIKSKINDPNKRIVVTETGWPWQGASNRLAVPGLSQQSAAIKSIQTAFADRPGDVILFSAFNDLWKHTDAGTFFAEKFWGIGGADSDADR